jgi:hypothetical protein
MEAIGKDLLATLEEEEGIEVLDLPVLCPPSLSGLMDQGYLRMNTCKSCPVLEIMPERQQELLLLLLQFILGTHLPITLDGWTIPRVG